MTSTPDVVDLFAGPAGWDEGLRAAGYTGDVVGLDYSPDACATAEAAGHRRILADLTDYPPDEFAGVDAVIGSPTCRPWSRAGNGGGFADPRGELTRVPLRWTLALRPRWFAFEQVPAVLPVWQQVAAELGNVGYSTWVGVVNAKYYGVAQDRRRAIVYGRLDGPVDAPVPTTPGGVSMAQALGWSGAVLVSNYGTGGDPRARGRRTMDRPSFTVTGKCCRNRWEWPDGSTRRLTPAEAATLQGFRPDYPFTGGSTSVQQQIGDAVPPPLAAAVVAPLLALAAGERMAA